MLDGVIQKTRPSKNELLLLTLLIICAIILRVWDLGAVGFNNDEAIYSGQAATLAGYDEFQKHFSIFRAHPLLLQFTISVMFGMFGISDAISRIVPAVFGVSTIILTYFIGKNLYDRKIAIVTTIVITILPYHILLSRQVLLDVALSFFYTLTLFFIIRHLTSPRHPFWLYLVGASAGLSFLSKEVGIFALMSTIMCLFLFKTITLRNFLIVISTFLLASSPHWIPVLTIPEAHEAAVKYWNWQTSRDPNQSDIFYARLISQEALGYVLTALCLLSIIHALKSKNIKKPAVFLLLVWIALPLTLFQFLAVKGFSFVLPTIPAFVLLGVSFLFTNWMKRIRGYRIVLVAVIPLIIVFSGPPLHYVLQIPPIYLVGSGEEPHARAAANWIDDNLSDKAKFLTLDIRTANIIKYYSNHDAFSLHSNQNPAYTKVENSDLAILNGEIDFLVYEIYLAERFGYLKDEEDELNELVIKYNAIPIHTEYDSYMDESGQNLLKPALIIYSLNNTKQN